MALSLSFFLSSSLEFFNKNITLLKERKKKNESNYQEKATGTAGDECQQLASIFLYRHYIRKREKGTRYKKKSRLFIDAKSVLERNRLKTKHFYEEVKSTNLMSIFLFLFQVPFSLRLYTLFTTCLPLIFTQDLYPSYQQYITINFNHDDG